MDHVHAAIPVQSKPMHTTIYADERALSHALALIESGNEPRARGDLTHPDGPALGAFQIHQKAWDDISAMRRSKAQCVHPYHSAYDPHIAREYALTFIREIAEQFRRHHRAKPTPQLLYACYSLGPSIPPKIKSMTSVTLTFSAYDSSLVAPLDMAKSYRPLTEAGYSVPLAKRKMATGERYQNLIYAHHESLHSYGIPLLWQ